MFVLAAVDAVNSYKRGLYGETPSSPGAVRNVIIAAVAVVTIWAAVYFWDRILKKRAAAKASPRSLFGDLASAHGLTAVERKQLETAAQQAGVQPPAAIFVMPELVEPFAQSGRHSEAWKQIVRKVYGDWA